MSRRSFGKTAQVVARGGICSALGVVILLLAQPFEVLDLTLATIASLLVWFFAAEYGLSFAFCVYLSTTLLSFILTPANSGTVVYAMVLGWYPIFKVFVNRKIASRAFGKIVRLLCFSAAFLLMILLFFKIFVGEMDFAALCEELPAFSNLQTDALVLIVERSYWGLNLIQWAMIALYMLFVPVLALLYDLFLEKLILFYVVKIRPILLKRGIVKNGYK